MLSIYLGEFNTEKLRSVSVVVKLNVESKEIDQELELPRDFAQFSKTCKFLVTPVPGMEMQPAGIEGVQIVRVIVDEEAIEVRAQVVVQPFGMDFEKIRSSLLENGWHETT